MAERSNHGALTRRGIIVAALAAALSVLTPAFACATPPEPAGLPAELVRALDAYNDATIRNDTAALAQLVTEDYMLVNSDASVQGKSSYLADFLVPGFKVDPYTVELPVHRIFGDTALTGGVVKLGWTQEGRHQSRQLRIVHFWLRQDDRWRIAYTQLTRVPD